MAPKVPPNCEKNIAKKANSSSDLSFAIAHDRVEIRRTNSQESIEYHLILVYDASGKNMNYIIYIIGKNN